MTFFEGVDSDSKVFDRKILVMDDLRRDHPEMFREGGGMDWKRFEKDFRPKYPIQIRRDKKSISFTFGENACGLEHVSQLIGMILVYYLNPHLHPIFTHTHKLTKDLGNLGIKL